MFVTLPGIVIAEMSLRAKAPIPIVFTLLGMSIVRMPQRENASLLIVRNPLGRSKPERLVQPANARYPNHTILLDNFTVDNSLQSRNAHESILVTPSGI